MGILEAQQGAFVGYHSMFAWNKNNNINNFCLKKVPYLLLYYVSIQCRCLRNVYYSRHPKYADKHAKQAVITVQFGCFFSHVVFIIMFKYAPGLEVGEAYCFWVILVSVCPSICLFIALFF